MTATSTASVKFTTAYGSIWDTGDLVAGYEIPRWPATDQEGVYSVVLCVEARQVNNRGAVRKPAQMATIADTSWDSVCDEVEVLGFSRPNLTAEEVRDSRHRP